MTDSNYDDLFYHVLATEGNIAGFFEKVFDFLYRRTDYFKIKNEENSELGLLAGQAEDIIKNVFCKYMKRTVEEQSLHEDNPLPLNYVHEETVETTELYEEESSQDKDVANIKDTESKFNDSDMKIAVMDPDCYNGARYDTYSWAQTLRDIDIRVKVNPNTISGKQVRVSISQKCLKVEILDDQKWEVLKEDKFSYKINVEESTWTLVPREYIHIYLLKIQERWWDSVFVEDPKIDLKVIDSSIAYEELDQDSQNKIEELMYNEHLKRLGKPTIQQSKIHAKLKEAWSAEGSPFKGQPYDPTLLDITHSENHLF